MNQKISATLTGLAIGDSVGGPFEFLTNKEIQKAMDDERWGGEFLYNTIWDKPLKPGQYTDDTLMAICIADCLITHGRYDQVAVAKNYVNWYESGDLRGIGCQTEQSIRNLIAGDNYDTCGIVDNTGKEFDYCGNGALMRIAPIGIFYRGQLSHYKFHENDAKLTHNHQDAFDANYYLLNCIGFLSSYSANDKFGRLKYMAEYEMIDGNVQKHLIKAFKKGEKTTIEDIIELGTDGTAHETLATSILCFLTTNSFTEAIIKAILVGGDTDTRAAIVGAMAGTYYGFKGILEYYLKNIENSRQLIAYDVILSQGFRNYYGIFN